MTVTSDSMFPTLKLNDIIIVEPVGIDEINPDTAILFAEPVRYFLVAIIVTGVLLARKSIPKKSIEVTLVEISKRSVKQD